MQQKVFLWQPSVAALSACFAAVAAALFWLPLAMGYSPHKLLTHQSLVGLVGCGLALGCLTLVYAVLRQDPHFGILRRANLMLPFLALVVALVWSAASRHDWLALLFERRMLVLAAGGTLLFLALALFYHAYRPVPMISRMGFAFLGLPAFCVAATLFSILSITTALPMTDALLARMDALMGLDWPAFYRWSAQQPLMRDYAHLVYHFCFAITVPLLIVHALAWRDVARIEHLIAFLMISMLVTITIGALFPSVSGPAYHDIPLTLSESVNAGLDRRYEAFFMAVRGGAKIALGDIMQGTVTFPSYHALIGVAGVLYTLKCPLLRWVVIPPCIAMIGVTPVIGGHYFVDILGGLVVALLTYALVDWMARCDNRADEKVRPTVTP